MTSSTLWTIIGLAVLLVIVAIGCGRRTQVDTNHPPAPEVSSNQYPHFVFAKVMDPVMPIERGEKYEDPLFDTLEARGLGEVTGGGSLMNKDNQIEWVGIDLQLADLDGAVELVRARLRELGAPAGSVLEFKRDGQDVTVSVH